MIKNIFKNEKLKKIIPKISLGTKLTIYFMIFGIIIGYMSYVFYTIGVARNNIETAYKTIMPIIKNATGSKGEDFLADLVNKRNDDVLRMYKMIVNSSFSGFGKIIPVFFYSDRNHIVWKEMYIDNGNVFRARPALAAQTPDLDTAAERVIYYPSHIFWGRDDRISILLRLPMPAAKNTYVMSLEMNREGIVNFTVKHIEHFILFSVLLILISIILGRFFASRIVGPIRKLSKVAQARADGDLTSEFYMDRNDEIGVLADSLNIMTRKIDSHVKEIERRMKTMATMNKIDKAVLSSISRTDLLDRVIALVSSLYHGNSITMFLYNEEQKRFELLSRYRGASQGILAEKPFIPAGNIGEEALKRIQQVFQFTPRVEEKSYRELFEKLAGSEIGVGLNVPVFMADRYLGSMILARDEAHPFSSEEIESVAMLADQVGIALQSIRYLEEREQLILGILLALTRSIDAKSKWTAGHSERVAAYSEKIAIRLNMEEREIRTVTFSAILHDIGKIAVPEYILDKPGKLTNEEFAAIKEHPRAGARIISDLPSNNRILPGILYHHEHWDGSGYPEGLAGDAIPLSSRIITVADVWDAITADRPYRKGFPRMEAIEFMKKNCGVLFDSSIVEVFLEIISEEKLLT
ncbi:MAG: HD domain-containing phosphohydrolase [Smithella sp.]|jgi:HD-GYP domain-containing protein (c-di-GMP phosphodiesterase class II)